MAQRQHRPDLDANEVLCYAIKPKDLYPAMITYIQSALTFPINDVLRGLNRRGRRAIRPLYNRAKALPAHAWQLALMPRDTVEEENPLSRLFRGQPASRAEALLIRAAALECARLWYTELLHERCAHRPLHLHITRDTRYRL